MSVHAATVCKAARFLIAGRIRRNAWPAGAPFEFLDVSLVYVQSVPVKVGASAVRAVGRQEYSAIHPCYAPLKTAEVFLVNVTVCVEIGGDRTTAASPADCHLEFFRSLSQGRVLSPHNERPRSSRVRLAGDDPIRGQAIDLCINNAIVKAKRGAVPIGGYTT